ncbi:MAG: RagB/SusD family nutrient uptake outer membrane protein [bacterium]
MNPRILVLLAGLGIAAAACKDSTGVNDLNNISDDLTRTGLTPPSASLLVTGLLDASRQDLDIRYLIFSSSMGRDFYRLDNAEARWINETVGANPADFSGFVGGGAFGQFYGTIHTGNVILNMIPKATGLTPQELLATQGMVNTFKALSYYRALTLRDSLGIALDVNHPFDDPPAPFVCKPNVLAAIALLLDSAATELSGGGATFPFPIPSGFRLHGDFSTPAAMLKVAKGLKGKIELYRGLSHQKPNVASFATALADLNASFADPAQGMDTGIYYTYSTASGDLVNQLADANVYLNPYVGDSIQAGDRRASKITVLASTKSLFGVKTRYKTPLTDPSDLARPMPILKNSELLLLRAQANIELGNLGAATADINAVRTADGGLAPIAVPATKAEAISAVLYEKRYSLLGEGANRLVDLRAYGRLNAAAGPGAPGDLFQAALPIPKSQLDARNVTSITPNCP